MVHRGRVDAVGGDDEVPVSLRAVLEVDDAPVGVDGRYGRELEHATPGLFGEELQLVPQIRPEDRAADGVRVRQGGRDFQGTSIEELTVFG